MVAFIWRNGDCNRISVKRRCMQVGRSISIVFGTALLIAAAVVVALRERHQAPLPDVPVAQTSAEVRVKGWSGMSRRLILAMPKRRNS